MVRKNAYFNCISLSEHYAGCWTFFALEKNFYTLFSVLSYIKQQTFILQISRISSSFLTVFLMKRDKTLFMSDNSSSRKFAQILLLFPLASSSTLLTSIWSWPWRRTILIIYNMFFTTRRVSKPDILLVGRMSEILTVLCACANLGSESYPNPFDLALHYALLNNTPKYRILSLQLVMILDKASLPEIKYKTQNLTGCD